MEELYQFQFIKRCSLEMISIPVLMAGEFEQNVYH